MTSPSDPAVDAYVKDLAASAPDLIPSQETRLRDLLPPVEDEM